MTYEVLGIIGNRPHKLQSVSEFVIRRRLSLLVEGFRDQGGKKLISGGALGVDQWAIQAAIDAGIDFDIYQPFPGQSNGWKNYERMNYNGLAKQADSVVTFGSEFSNKHYFKRNAQIVKDSDLMLAVLASNSKGGARWTFDYAKQAERDTMIMLVKTGSKDTLEERFIRFGQH